MNEYYFHLDHLTVGYDKKPLIKDICIGIEKGEIVNSVNMPRMPLDKVDGARTCVIHKADVADAVKAVLGADAKSAVRGAYGYSVVDSEADAAALEAIDGVIRVRVIK